MNYLAVVCITGIVCATIYGLFELFARRKERTTLIEKLSEIKNLGKIEGKINLSFGRSMSFWALRSGCLLLGIGLGLFFGCLLASELIQGNNGEVNYGNYNIIGMAYGATILIFGGLGLVVAFITERLLTKKERE